MKHDIIRICWTYFYTHISTNNRKEDRSWNKEFQSRENELKLFGLNLEENTVYNQQKLEESM